MKEPGKKNPGYAIAKSTRFGKWKPVFVEKKISKPIYSTFTAYFTCVGKKNDATNVENHKFCEI